MPHTKSKPVARNGVKAPASRALVVQPSPVIDEMLVQARTTTQRAIDQTVHYARGHPDKAMLYALAAGYVLRTLPVTRVLGGVLRIALPLIKPAAVLYGISKVMVKKRG